MQSEQDEFARFLTTREQAAIAFLNGDANPLNGLVASALPVSFFEPGGAVAVGNAEVRERYRKNAEPFSRGSYSIQILHSESAAGIGYVVGIVDFQHHGTPEFQKHAPQGPVTDAR